MQLKDRNRHRQEKTKCHMCGAENEDLRHFLLWCPAYAEERKKCVRLQQPYVEEEDNTMAKFVSENDHTKETKATIYKFWKIREKNERKRGRK